MTTRALSVPSAAPALRKKILSLAWPVILNNLLLTFVWIVDMVMVGRLGPTAVAAIGVSGQFLNLIMALTLAVTTGTVSLVARYVGAKEHANANAVLGQSLILSMIFSATLVIPAFVAAGPLFRMFGAEPAVTELGVPYLHAVVAGTVFLVQSLVFSAALRGAGDTKTPLYVAAVSNVFHVALNYGLIFGKFGLPQLGVFGAGIGTFITFFLESASFLFLFLRGGLAVSLSRKALRIDRSIMLKTLRIGSPSAIEQGLLQVGFLWYLAIITRYGTDPLAAYTIGVNLMSLSFMPGFGFSVAASALVGQSLGAGDPDSATQQGSECTKMAVLSMSVLGIILFIAARPTALVYGSEADVLRHTVNFVRILALCQPAMAVHFALTGVLIGAADTRWPLYGSFIGMFLIRLPLALLVSSVLGLSVNWVWLIILADHYGKASVLIWRFVSGKWKTISV